MIILHGRQGYSLIEVMVAVTILSLIGISTLSLSGYNKIIVSKVEKRFLLYNRMDALTTDMTGILKLEDDQFPYLRPEEEQRIFTGNDYGLKWEAVLTRFKLNGFRGIYKLKLFVEYKNENADTEIYLRSIIKGEENNEAG